MDDSIYEVTRDEYACFMGQINKKKVEVKIEQIPDYKAIKVYSKKTKTHLCTRTVPQEEKEQLDEHYYIFNDPDKSEMQQPKPVQKIVLETREEVQTFFEILSKLSKKGKNK